MEEYFTGKNGESTTLRKAQNRLLEILIEVDRICKKHKIEYWLIAGTLLGAVRHKGFIPWDDDIDICVKQEDLKNLTEILINELPSQFAVQNENQDPNYYIQSVLKIRDKKSKTDIEFYKPFKEQGLFLDIIPMEKIPSMKFKEFVFKFNKFPYLRSQELALKGNSNNLIGWALTPLSRTIIRFAHWYSNKSRTRNWGYNYLFWVGKAFYFHFDEKIIFPLKTMEFEGRQFSTPNNPDAWLTMAYGDYMKIPKVNERQIHTSKIDIYE